MRDVNAGMVMISVTVFGADTYTRARVRIPDPNNEGSFVYDQETFSYPFVFPAWDTTASGAGNYTIFWEVENSLGRIQTLTTSFEVAANLACQITPSNPSLWPVTGKPSDRNTKLSWDIVNNAGKDLEIVGIDV